MALPIDGRVIIVGAVIKSAATILLLIFGFAHSRRFASNTALPTLYLRSHAISRFVHVISRNLSPCQLPAFPFKMKVANQQPRLKPFDRQRGNHCSITYVDQGKIGTTAMQSNGPRTGVI